MIIIRSYLIHIPATLHCPLFIRVPVTILRSVGKVELCNAKQLIREFLLFRGVIKVNNNYQGGRTFLIRVFNPHIFRGVD